MLLPVFLPSSVYMGKNEVALRFLVDGDVVMGVLYGADGSFELYGSRPAFEVVG